MRFSYDDISIYREIEKDGNGAGDQFQNSIFIFQKNVSFAVPYGNLTFEI
jgi:hypothetical protein